MGKGRSEMGTLKFFTPLLLFKDVGSSLTFALLCLYPVFLLTNVKIVTFL